jgi:hypothetical protein
MNVDRQQVYLTLGEYKYCTGFNTCRLKCVVNAHFFNEKIKLSLVVYCTSHTGWPNRSGKSGDAPFFAPLPN